MIPNVIWDSHGSQISHEKKYYYFPFKSLSFYTPQGQKVGIPHSYRPKAQNLSIQTGITWSRNICKNSVDNIWLKEPMFDKVDSRYDYNLILSNERYTQIWNIIEEEIKVNEDLRESGVEESELMSMSNDDIQNVFDIYRGEKLDRLKELWLRNSDNISLIELRPMILQLNDDESGGMYLCDRKTHNTKPIMNDNDIKEYNNNDINISLENTFQLIENKLKEKNENPSDFNISMLVCRNNHGQTGDIFEITAVDYVKTYRKPSTEARGHITNPDVVNVSEDQLSEYLSGSYGSIHKKKRKNKTKRKRKIKTKRKRKNKTKRKNK